MPGASISDAAKRTGDYVSKQSSNLTAQGTAFVREQPLLALALTGAVCLVLGFLLGRR